MMIQSAAIVAATTAAITIAPLSIQAFSLTSTSTIHNHIHQRQQQQQHQQQEKRRNQTGTRSNFNFNPNERRMRSVQVSTESIANDVQEDGSNNDNDSYNDSDSHREEEWWESFQFKDAKLAESIRNDFPILTATNHFENENDNDNENNNNETTTKKLIYFDSAATSQKPTQVINKLSSYYSTINSNVHRGAHTLSQRATTEYEASRDKIQSFINAPSRNEIIFTAGASEALNLVAATWGRKNVNVGDDVLISELEHHSNIVPWQMLCEEVGATLKYIPIDVEKQCLDFGGSDGSSNNDDGRDNDGSDVESILDGLITPNTKVVSLQHVSNVLATIHPISTIVTAVRSKAHPECIILLDACQSIPHMPVDVQSLGVDFIAASGHKMCAPTGIGFLWGKEELLNAMPPYMGGGEMIDEVYMDHSTYAPCPSRFEAGTPQIAQAIGLGAAIDYLEGVVGGMGRIHAYEQELGAYLLRRMSEVEGVTVLGPGVGVDRAAIVSFVCEGVHPSDLSTFLDMEGVAIRAGHHCCQPMHRALGYSHSARASLYFYNTKEEVDDFIVILKDTLKFLGGAGVGGGEDDDDDFVPFI